MVKRKLIIDTDPGCDDVLALLLALSSSPEEVEILLISVTYGNVAVQSCLQNVVSTFHVIEQERKWRQAQSLPDIFPLVSQQKPLVAVGADGPFGGQKAQADYYHGIDGLGGISISHPHFTAPQETWSHLFSPPPPHPPSNDPITVSATLATHINPPTSSHLFRASSSHSVNEILTLLASNERDTITLVGLGPLTNFALAAARDPITFLRAREVLIMGGALDVPGNITPVGEFNILADPLAAARVFALTSPNPASTFPEARSKDEVPGYPDVSELGERRLNVVMFPLDVTMRCMLQQKDIDGSEGKGDIPSDLSAQSPLAEWVRAFTGPTFSRNAKLMADGMGEMALHDPLVVWYALTSPLSTPNSPATWAGGDRKVEAWKVKRNQDVRVETTGQWTKGMCVVDRRGRNLLLEEVDLAGSLEEFSSDKGGWLSRHRGNRVGVCVESGEEGGLARVLAERIFRVGKI